MVYTLLAALAARTSTLRLGVLATSVLYREPTLLAKMVTTLDVLPGGRAVLGIGAGHPRTEGEHLAYGYNFPAIAERMPRLEAALPVIQAMTGSEPVDGAPPNWPRPIQPRIPVLVAGSGEQRLLRIAARYADLINLSFPSGDTLARVPHKLVVLARHCQTVGRNPADISVTYKALLSVAPSLEEARAKWDRWRTARGIGDVDSGHGVFVGDTAGIADQLSPWLAVGIDHIMFERPMATTPRPSPWRATPSLSSAATNGCWLGDARRPETGALASPAEADMTASGDCNAPFLELSRCRNVKSPT